MDAEQHTGLSIREELVATKFAEGMTYREIGETLFISPATVRTHLSAIYQKLGVHNKLALANLLAVGRIEDTAESIPNGSTHRNSGPPIVAVLPFDNLGSDERLAHLAQCLSADIIADLARYPDLAVSPA